MRIRSDASRLVNDQVPHSTYSTSGTSSSSSEKDQSLDLGRVDAECRADGAHRLGHVDGDEREVEAEVSEIRELSTEVRDEVVRLGRAVVARAVRAVVSGNIAQHLPYGARRAREH